MFQLELDSQQKEDEFLLKHSKVVEKYPKRALCFRVLFTVRYLTLGRNTSKIKHK